MAKPQQFEFLAEAREHLTEVCDQLLRLERASDDEARGRVEQILRAVHSIKGGAGFFGLRAIEQLAHRTETVLEGVASGTVLRDARLIDALLAATDRLAALLDDVDNSNDADIGGVLVRLDAVQSGGLATDRSTPDFDLTIPPAVDDTLVAVTPDARGDHEFEITLDLSRCSAAGTSPLEVVERVSQLGKIVAGQIDTTGIDLSIGPPVHPVIWRATITSPLDRSSFISQLGLATPPTSEFADQVEAIRPSAAASAAPTPAAASTIRIPVELVDHLMSLAGELVLVRNQSRRFTDSDQPLPGQVLQRLDSVTTAFQETVLQTRMQPVGHLFNKFPRLVRDLSRQLGKQLDLRISGAEVELDKTILDALSDPLTHLVRNACDHGIEMAAARQQAGKPALGTVWLTARHFGDQIWITIEDDGRGIDREAVRRKALQQKLRTAEELARLDDRELLALILLPGFSTASQVTDVSGRGVGMDVVKTNLARLGGGIEIESRPGAGTKFTLRLPLTLAIIPTLLVAADGERFAIPQKDLEELVFIDPHEPRARIEHTPEGDLVRLRGRLLPLLRLSNVLQAAGQMPQPATYDVTQPLVFAVVRAGARRFGLVVDSVLTSEEIVVKPLHSALRRLTKYSGATVLGDGRVALILNTEGLAQAARVRFHADSEPAEAASEELVDQQSVLVVRQLDGGPLAFPVSLVRRITMVQSHQIEDVAGGRFVTIDDVPTQLIALSEELDALAGSQPLIVVLPRDAGQAVGFPVREVSGIERITLDDVQTLPGDRDDLKAAVIQGKITPLADRRHGLPRGITTTGRTFAQPSGAGARVLLVDDTQFFRDVVGKYLTENGLVVTTAEDGEQALARLAADSFDIVVSDLEMPVMDGWTLAANIRRDPAHRDLPLLSLSTLSGHEASAKSLAHGFNAHEVKLNRDSLLATIHRLLQSSAVASTAKEAEHA